MAGPWAWLRSNLFNSWWSTAVTLVLGYFVIRVVFGLVEWGVVHAIWTVPYSDKGIADTTVCQNAKGTGACWAVIADKYRLILFGRYPYDEQWRPAIVVLLFIGALCRLRHAAVLAQGTGADLDRHAGGGRAADVGRRPRPDAGARGLTGAACRSP